MKANNKWQKQIFIAQIAVKLKLYIRWKPWKKIALKNRIWKKQMRKAQNKITKTNT